MLHIFLITYNRSNSLRRTLSALSNGSFRNVPITILDNCSNEETCQVVEAFQKEGVLCIKYIHHPVNIGASANALRAYELADSRYVWILCDDDNYDFSGYENVIGILDNDSPDVLIVGSPLTDSSDRLFPGRVGKLFSSRDFQDTQLSFVLTFLPAAIIKREKLLSCDFSVGYALSPTFFSQYFWIGQCFNKNWLVYVLPWIIVARPIMSHGLETDFVHINGYLRAAKLLERSEDAEQAFISYTGAGYWGYFRTIVSIMLKSRLAGKFRWIDWKEHFVLLDPIRAIVFVFASCALLTPMRLIGLLFAIRRRCKGRVE